MADIDFTPGRWAVCRGSMPLMVTIMAIGRVGERQIFSTDRRPRIALRAEVLATFTTYPEAERLRNRIGEIRAERDRRFQEASDDADAAVAELLENLNG